MSKKLLQMTLLTSLVLMASVLFPYRVQAVDPTTVYVDPSSIVNEALVPNSTFNITVKVDDIAPSPGVVGVQFKLTWNASVLNALSMNDVIFHEVTPESEWANIWQLSSIVNNTGGYVEYAYTFLSIQNAIDNGYAPINGSHTVARITMKVMSLGKTSLHFEMSKLGDRYAGSISHEKSDGYFSNLPPPPPALLYIDPSRISNTSLVPCNNITFAVNIANASGILDLEFKLSFNSTLLQLNSVLKGSFVPPLITPTIEINNTSGFVRFNVTFSTPMSGDGVLAEMSFHIEEFGKTSLHLYDVGLYDEIGQSLDFTTSDGSFDNVLTPKLAVEPPVIIDPTLLPPATFTVNITIAEVRDLYGYQYNLTFDPNILICLQVQIHDILNEPYYIPNQIIDNTEGFVFVNVTYYPPATPIDVDPPTALATIKYRVKAVGGTNLTLTDTQLEDSSGQPIAHEVYHGYFQSLVVDIAVVDLFADPNEFYKGRSTNITVTVANQGNSTESFTVDLYYNGTFLGAANINNLLPDTNTSATVLWSTATVQWGKYQLSAQVTPRPYEIDIVDNSLVDGIVKVRIPGDINGDDTVDILDAVLASAAYGSAPGDPNWNADVDLNNDNVIDIFDMIILANYFGTTI